MKGTIIGTLASTLLCLLAASADAQPALRELENRLNRLLAPPAEAPAAPTTPLAPRSEPGFAGFFADNAGSGIRGAVVTSVNRGGPAEAAGLKTGDLITSANGRRVVDIDDLSEVLGGSEPGDTVELTVQRDGVTRAMPLTLSRRPSGGGASELPPATLPQPAPAADAAPGEHGSLGVRVVPVTDDVRARYGISVRRGAVIQSLTSGGSAQRAGLQVGSVIVSIDGRRVDSPDDLIGYIRTTVAGQRVEVDYYQGDRLERVQAELGPSGAPALVRPSTPPRAATPLTTPGRVFGGDRPALRKIESVIDRLVAPAPSGVPLAPPVETGELQSRVDALERQVEALQRQITELERRLGETR